VGSRDDHGGGTEPIISPSRLLTLHRLSFIRCASTYQKSLAVFLLRSCPIFVTHHSPRHHVHAYRTTRHTKFCPQRRPPSGRIWQQLPRARSEGRSAALPLFSTFVLWSRKYAHFTAFSLHEPTLHLAAAARRLPCTNPRPFCPSAVHHGTTGVLFSRKSVSTPTSTNIPTTFVTSTTGGRSPLFATLIYWWWKQLIGLGNSSYSVSSCSG
jgi:hypothetical protein